MTITSRTAQLFFAVAAAAIPLAGGVHAAINYFNTPSGNWNVAGNWLDGVVPGGGTPPEIGVIDLGQTATIDSVVPTVQ